MPAMQLNGAEFYYELSGRGKPLVLIAGYNLDHNFWNLMVEVLAAKFQVLVFDNRGIGQTKDNGTPFTLEIMAEDTMALIKQLGLIKPHILGQSMGGAVAQIVARKYAGEIDKLILLNSVAKFNQRTIKTMESLLKCRQENVSFDLFVELAMPWFFSSNYLGKEENIVRFKELLKNNPYPQSIDDQQRQLKALSIFSSRTWLKDISVSTLVIAAEEDIVALPAESEELANMLPNATFTMIPDAHSSAVEQSQKLNQLIVQFCSGF